MYLRYLLFFSCLFHISLQRSTPQDDHYVAAVVEYAVSSDVEQNKQAYTQLIKDAADQLADIVIFPELTLTNNTISFEVPINGLLLEYPIPALHPELYDDLLVSMSEAARANQIYVVLNTRERVDCAANNNNENCPEAKLYIFNTNVVFDRTGAVIDRYRKINLFGEAFHTPAITPDLGIFETDFGVTFGHFICFDLQFQVPAVQVVQKNQLTDVIFTTMWYSELPYLTAVQIQEAYAYAMNVNFLGAAASNPSVGSAGSGIFSGKAGALISIMPGVLTTRLLVAKVPKVPGLVTDTVPGPIYDPPSDHDGLRLLIDPSLVAHTSKRLVEGFQEFTLTDKDVTCTFRIRLDKRNGETKYKYRAAAFSGVRTFSGFASGGTRICSVFACIGDTMDTCGRRFNVYTANSTAHFEELSISATFPTPIVETNLQATDSAIFPVALKTSIMPLEPEDYIYAVTSTGNNTVFDLKLVGFDEELYSFAVWSRVFGTDGQEPDPALSEEEEIIEETVPEEATPEDAITEESVTEEAIIKEPVVEGSTDASVRSTMSRLLLVPVLMLVTLDGFYVRY